MRIYEKGEKVLLPDDTIGTVQEVRKGSYELPEGQNIGAAPGATKGGEASYKVKNEDGDVVEMQDRDLRNPPKDSGHFTAYAGDVTSRTQAEKKASRPKKSK